LLVLGDDLTGLLVQLLEPRAHGPALGVELHPSPGQLLVELGVVLALVALERRGEGLLQPRQDRVERDPLLPFELSERLDQCLVHRRPPLTFDLGAGPHSTPVRAAVTSSNRTVRSPSSVAIRTSSRPAWTMVPVTTRAPSTGRAVLTFTLSPTRRAKSSGRRS